MGGWQSTWTAISSGISGAPGTQLLKLGIPEIYRLARLSCKKLVKNNNLTHICCSSRGTNAMLTAFNVWESHFKPYTLYFRISIAIGVVACAICFTPLPNQPSLRQSLCLQKRFKQRWTCSNKLLRTFVSTAARGFVRTVESCLQHPRKGKMEDQAKYSCYSSMVFDAHKNKK